MPHCLLYFAERGSGPPLLLVHGLMVTGEMFEPVIEHLATRHRVIVPDLRGHGRSRRLPPPYTAAQPHLTYRACWTIWASTLPRYSATRRAVQLRNNWSSTTPSDATASCSHAPTHSTWRHFREKLEGHFFSLLVKVLGMRRFAKFVVSQGLKQLGKERADWADRLAGVMADQDRKLMLSAWKETMAFDSRRRLAKIGCPTLVVAASNDQAVPIHHAKMLHNGITGSQLVIIDGASHALIWKHSDELVRATDEFLGA
jgi:pimeloyl-ACP methyl ester carboxylesterase